MSGVKGRSGPRAHSKNRGDAQRSLTAKLPMAIDVIIETAEGTIKDRMRYEAAIEIKDSCIGKPKQQTDIDLKGGEQLGAGVVVKLFELLAQKQREFNAIQGPRETKELPEGLGSTEKDSGFDKEG